MAQLLFGKGYLVNAGDPTFNPTGEPVGYVTPLVPAPEVVDQDDEIKLMKNVLGVVEGVIAPDDCILRATFNYIPRGSTKAAAALSAALPEIGAFTITGLPIVQVRKFTDAFNTNVVTNPWFYFGGGSLRGDEDGKNWTGTITLMRFWSITSGTPIS
jgi:hypothetical protein